MNIWLDDDDRVSVPSGFIQAYCLIDVLDLLDANQEEIEVMDFDYDLRRGVNGLEVMKYIYHNYPERYPKKVMAHSRSSSACELLLQVDSNFRIALAHKGSQK